MKVTGKLYNGIAAYVFTSADGTVVGTIPYSELGTIIWENGLSYVEADEQKAWFVENFNIYRGLDSGSYESGSGSTGGSSSSGKVDIEEYKDELIRLVNEERTEAGLLRSEQKKFQKSSRMSVPMAIKPEHTVIILLEKILRRDKIHRRK